MLGTGIVFAALLVFHQRVIDSLDVSKRRLRFYERALARIEDRWAGSGENGQEFRDSDHPYADDLDVFGDNGLYQLLCTCRTRMGKKHLASWLLSPAILRTIEQRQAAVRELRCMLDFREELSVLGNTDQIQSDPVLLARWATENADLNYQGWWPVAFSLSLASVASLSYGLAKDWLPFLNVLVLCLFVSFKLRRRLERILADIGSATRDISLLALLMQRIEHEKFEAPLLQALRQRLVNGGLIGSQAIAKLGWIADFESSRHSSIGRLIDRPLMYSVQVACAFQRWRHKYGDSVRAWLDAIGEMESLIALSTYSYEHPGDPFPDFPPASEGICIFACSLGHPLLADSGFVRNDVSLHQHCRILLVSGSNMSGKSTFLRVLGINAVLAMMGAPVRAGKFRMSPISIGTSIRISDSLQEGVSRFYAEIKRIRNVVQLASRTPTLFLFDEILQGTNSHDRRIGAGALLKSLLRYNAIGLVTTHDLALTHVSDPSAPIRNVHFQERLEASKLSFDYRLREGVVTTSNGLELMRSIGLEV
jgi:DNA mismatch repair ATPase MutS